MTQDKPRTEWGPVRPFTNFPPIEPQPFDTRDSTYIPDLSVTDPKIQKLSVRKIRGIGIKVYLQNDQTFAAGTEDNVAYNVISWQRGMETVVGDTSSLVIPYTGVYLITMINGWAGVAGTAYARIGVNGTAVEQASGYTPGGVSGPRLALTVVNSYTAGDLIQGLGYQSPDLGGATRDVLGGEPSNTLTAILLFAR